MQGTMRQRGAGAWELKVYLGRDAVSGRKRWAYKTVRGGKREAQRALAQLVAETGRQQVVPARATVGELLEQWFAHARADFSPKTVRETRGFLDRNLIPALGPLPLGRLGTHDIDRLYRRLRASGGADGSPLAPATVKRIHGILRRALEQGVRWGWLPSNPAAAASPPRVVSAELIPPTPADVARLFALAQQTDPELATFVFLAAATGARRSELVALRWSGVDLDGGVVTIRRGLVLGPDGFVEKDTKTHGVRSISIDPTALEGLAAHRRRMDDRASLCGTRLTRDAFVFSHAVDGSHPWRPDSTTRAQQLRHGEELLRE